MIEGETSYTCTNMTITTRYGGSCAEVTLGEYRLWD